MSIHRDHRSRVKKRFVKEGLEGFDDLHILEMMLFYCVPRKDTNELAHNLLDRFGSLPQVLDATPDQLQKVDGIGEGVSTFVMFLRELHRAYEVRKNQDVRIINSLADVKKCVMSRLEGQRNEMVYLLCLDGKQKLICIEKVSEGSVNSTNISTRRIVELALAVNAVTVILVHNHPGGVAIPSYEDVNATKYIAQALRKIEIQLADHVIVADGDYVSLVQSAVYDPDRDSV